jgi:3-methyladenine DNA glycosylase/8-oxoguanine DNA glycosylase
MNVHRKPPSSVQSILTLTTPPGFNFWMTAYSHGWSDLPPFSFNKEEQSLERIFSLDGRSTIACRLSADGPTLKILASSKAALSKDQKREIRGQVRTCLRLDEDFSEFHAAARRIPRYRWIATSGAGRLLRAPTLFEDIVKMICTTNCTWALTRLMVSNITAEFGESFAGGSHAFPTPEQLANTRESVLRRRCKTGYRAPYLLEFAERVATGTLRVEGWRQSPLPTEELFDSLRTIKGVGPYAAGNILKLIGRYDYLGLDSWVRTKFAELHSSGRRVKDRTIERAYAGLGKWRGLFFWLEMTRHWHADKFRGAADSV